MNFIRVVEVFPPYYEGRKTGRFNPQKDLAALVEKVRRIRRYGDIILVADLKDPRLLKVSTVQAASAIQLGAGLEAAPVITVRDSNGPMLRSTIITAYALGLKSVMLVWGDRYPPQSSVSNVYDYDRLSDAIAGAAEIEKGIGIRPTILAPVTLSSLETKSGRARARSRLRAGADFLLAQPPTTDSGTLFDRHLKLLDAAGLRSRSLLNVFPFRDEDDVTECERKFGWSLPERLHSLAAKGAEALRSEEVAVARRTATARLGGVYVSTRGEPEIAKTVLGKL